ncbi:MAG: hypothetical protein JWN84_556 [Nocardioides sp.]|nr:hypothetical protein [Nocardioides sp.]
MPAPASRFAYLDGLRGLAILAVLVVHWGIGRTTIGGGGYLGVDVFFVLSGFVITTVLWRSTSLAELSAGAAWRTFTRARVRRLYPALVGLVVFGSLLMMLPGTPVATGDVLRYGLASLAQVTWLVEMSGQVADPFRQTWSLGIEWLFYLTWPLVVLHARRRQIPARTVARWTAVGALVLLLGSVLLLDGKVFYGSPSGRFGQLLAGGALALALVASPPVARRRAVSTGACLVGLAALSAYVLVGPGPWDDTARLVGTPLATVVGVVLVHHGYAVQGGPVHAVLSSRWLSGLGRVSYSLYLWHWIPVYLLDADALGWPMPVVAVAGIALTVALTAASYLLLERPFLGSRGEALRPAQGTTHAAGTGQVGPRPPR